MDLTTGQTLDFFRIRDQVAGFCLTEEAKKLLQEESVLTETGALNLLRDEVKPFLDLLVRSGELPASDFPPVALALDHCAPEGSVLDGSQLKALARYATSAALWKRYLASREEKALQVWALRLADFSVLADQIHRVFDSQGEIIEDAVPSLVRLKGELSRTRTEIDQTARHWLKDSGNHDLWSGNNPTQKDGRTVLPLKTNFKGRIGAVVHDASASGATLYVEPYDLVEKNNKLVEVSNAWRAEVVKILRDFSAQVRDHREAFLTLTENMTRLDLYLSRARWGHAVKGAFPQMTKPGRPWKLVQARHPLLGETAVPINLELAEGVKVLLISGPNTGGKTVSLKTAGLLSLLHQFGLPIPAAPETILPVWDQVMTDIGDGQSLDQALSTFSSHMKRMAQILDTATDRSLVLLDEMASGTDPLEGGALGMSFLDCFLARGVSVLGTTHHGALKNFAYTKPGVKNASVEFDPAGHRPTYRILADVPGSSHALETAERVGIPADLVAQARSIIEGGETDVAEVIRNLKEKQLELRAREKEVEEKEQKFREEKRKNDLLQLRVKQYEGELKAQGLGEMNRFLAESRRQFEALVKEIREGSLTAEKIKEVRAFLDQTQGEAESQKERLHQEELQRALDTPEDDKEDSLPPPPEWKGGMEVWVEPGRQRGTVVRTAGKGQVLVAVGAVRMTVKEAQLRPVGPKTMAKVKPKTKVEVFTSESTGGLSPVFTLDLRGQRLEEALLGLEKQIDLALLKGLTEFSVIHGLGEGVLQKGVQDYLKNRREVKSFFFSRPEEGGFGKTIVQL